MPAKQKTTKNKKRTQKKLPLRTHVKATLLKISPHKHTGRLLSHRHTSHGGLLIILMMAGVTLLISLATLDSLGLTGGQVSVSLSVPGAAPTVGAVITNPVTQTEITQALLKVGGTCPDANVISVYNNGYFTGSSTCHDGIFEIVIQAQIGLNVLQAQNYDDLNQPGPATDQVTIHYQPLTSASTTNATAPIAIALNTAETIRIDPTIVNVVAPQPVANPCYDDNQALRNTGSLYLQVSCITRNIFVGETLSLPISIINGIKPYALSVDWGDKESPQVYSIQHEGTSVLQYTFKLPKVRDITLRVADSSGSSYILHTVVSVNSDGTAPTAGATGVQKVTRDLQNIWIRSSIPTYWAILALTCGFWVGDIFQRRFGLKN